VIGPHTISQNQRKSITIIKDVALHFCESGIFSQGISKTYESQPAANC
jgi:hypothetical protein